jgi:hypothetical protein
MRALKMSLERQRILLRALQDAQDWQSGLKAAYTPETWHPDPQEFKEMRSDCTTLIKTYVELWHVIKTLEVK